MTPRVIMSTMADDEPTAYTVEEISPGVFRYVYVSVRRELVGEATKMVAQPARFCYAGMSGESDVTCARLQQI